MIARAIIAITEVVKTTLTLFPVYANFPLFCPIVSINFPALSYISTVFFLNTSFTSIIAAAEFAIDFNFLMC